MHVIGSSTISSEMVGQTVAPRVQCATRTVIAQSGQYKYIASHVDRMQWPLPSIVLRKDVKDFWRSNRLATQWEGVASEQ